jgi:hypothetical protein
MVSPIWSRIKEAFDKGQKEAMISNAARRTFQWNMEGITTKENALDQMFNHYRKAESPAVKHQIVNYLEEIWRRH